jgi:hypothetical protein
MPRGPAAARPADASTRIKVPINIVFFIVLPPFDIWLL